MLSVFKTLNITFLWSVLEKKGLYLMIIPALNAAKLCKGLIFAAT